MTQIPERLTPKSQQVAAKVIDGEAVIINLANGVYYSMDKVGGLIWSMIERARSIDAIADAVAAAYDVAPPGARKDIEHLAAQLVAEDLVMAAGDTVQTAGADPAPTQQKLPYETPKLNIHRDMEELLALDPPMPGLQQTPSDDEGGPGG
jgi:hypothetical protein